MAVVDVSVAVVLVPAQGLSRSAMQWLWLGYTHHQHDNDDGDNNYAYIYNSYPHHCFSKNNHTLFRCQNDLRHPRRQLRPMQTPQKAAHHVVRIKGAGCAAWPLAAVLRPS